MDSPPSIAFRTAPQTKTLEERLPAGLFPQPCPVFFFPACISCAPDSAGWNQAVFSLPPRFIPIAVRHGAQAGGESLPEKSPKRGSAKSPPNGELCSFSLILTTDPLPPPNTAPSILRSPGTKSKTRRNASVFAGTAFARFKQERQPWGRGPGRHELHPLPIVQRPLKNRLPLECRGWGCRLFRMTGRIKFRRRRPFGSRDAVVRSGY